MFDLIHQNMDFRTNNAIIEQAQTIKIMNAQLISRLGFVVDEIKLKQRETELEINMRAGNISSPDAECIVEARLSLENAADYVGYSLNGLLSEVMFYINELEDDYFYPYIRILQWESNIIQNSVMSTIHRNNPVTDVANLIERLQGDYAVMVYLYQSSIPNIAREMLSVDRKFNEIKQTMFPQLNSIRDYFAFTSNFIRETLPMCEA